MIPLKFYTVGMTTQCTVTPGNTNTRVQTAAILALLSMKKAMLLTYPFNLLQCLNPHMIFFFLLSKIHGWPLNGTAFTSHISLI